MSDKQFLADQVKGGLVKIDYTGAVNNKYYMPMPMSTPEAGHDPITVRAGSFFPWLLGKN